MITSVIPLPCFHAPRPGSLEPTTIKAASYCNTESDDTLPFPLNISRGRDLSFTRPFYLYKLEMVVGLPGLVAPPGMHGRAYVVIATLHPINTMTLNSLDGVSDVEHSAMFPLYGRVDKYTVLFLDAINPFLDRFYTPDSSKGVTSMKNFVDTMVCAMGSIAENCPIFAKNAYSNLADPVRLLPLPSLISIVSSSINLNQTLENLAMDHFVLDFGIPTEFSLISGFTNLEQLRGLFNPYVRNTDEISNAALQASQTWANTRSELLRTGRLFSQSTDVILPAIAEENGRMSSFLSKLFSLPFDDFWFDAQGILQVSSEQLGLRTIDTHTGFVPRSIQGDGGYPMNELINYLVGAVDLWGKFPGRDFSIHRSCMEDVSIFDKKDGTLLLYIDLPMWLLASSDGLINTINTSLFV